MKGENMNAKRYDRHITIEQTSPTLKVTFFWKEGDSEHFFDVVQFKELEFHPLNVETACRSLNVFFMNSARLFACNHQAFMRSERCDHMSYYFDGVVDAEQPEQMFLSKYILEDAQQRAEGYRGDRHD